MAKIIVERPRHQPWLGKPDHPKRAMRRAAKLDPENAIAIRGMRRLAHASRGKHLKLLNENLAPLERFLSRAVGRPWNEVYSEITQHIRLSSAVQFHILQHIGDFVEVLPGLGRIWLRPRLWVDPVDGFLKRRERVPRERTAKVERKLLLRFGCELEPMRQYWQFDESWFRIGCRGRHVTEVDSICWRARVPGWFRAIVDRADRTRWLESARLSGEDAEAEAIALAAVLGPDRFPMRIVKLHGRQVRRELRRLSRHGLVFEPIDKLHEQS